MSCLMTTMVCLPSSVQQLTGLVCFFVGHAGGGFIHEEHFRILRQQHADFEPLL